MNGLARWKRSLSSLASGESHEAIRRGYSIEEDIRAALHAAELARDRFAVLPTETT